MNALSNRAWTVAGLAIAGAIGIAALILLPQTVELATLLDITVYVIMAILALSLGLVWGYGGILCFGQAAFFGLGAYTYAIVMFNMGESTVPALAGIALPAGFAALLGYFMFYGRISDVYLGVITLTVTLILFNAINSTAGPEYHIGSAMLGGFNGVPAIPPLNMPFDASAALDLNDMFYLAMGLLLLTYFGLRWLLVSHFGRVMVAISQNERRAEFLGYDARLYKLIAFTIGGAIAGMAGVLFANWGAFVSPTIFGLAQSAQIIIWVIVGGRGTLIGPIVGCIGIQWLTAWLGTVQLGGKSMGAWIDKALGGGEFGHVLGSIAGTLDLSNSNLVLGAVLLAFVLLVPKGIVPSIADLFRARVGLLALRRAPRTPQLETEKLP